MREQGSDENRKDNIPQNRKMGQGDVLIEMTSVRQ